MKPPTYLHSRSWRSLLARAARRVFLGKPSQSGRLHLRIGEYQLYSTIAAVDLRTARLTVAEFEMMKPDRNPPISVKFLDSMTIEVKRPMLASDEPVIVHWEVRERQS